MTTLQYQMTIKSTTSLGKDFVHLSCILHLKPDSQHLLITLSNIIIYRSQHSFCHSRLHLHTGSKTTRPFPSTWHSDHARTAQGGKESQRNDLSFLIVATRFENIRLHGLGQEWESRASNHAPATRQTTASLTPQPHFFFSRCFAFPLSSARCF